MEMKAGTYYIGDPCYVIREGWSKLLDETKFFKNKEQFWKEKRICCGSTAYGDGEYESNMGKFYGVDSGTIGIIPIEVIDVNKKEAKNLGSIEEFEKDFDVMIDSGLFIFGNVIIDTGFEDCDDDSEE